MTQDWEFTINTLMRYFDVEVRKGEMLLISRCGGYIGNFRPYAIVSHNPAEFEEVAAMCLWGALPR